MTIIDIVKILGASAAIIGTTYSILNSKRILLHRIDRKKSKIQQIDRKLVLKYGIYRGAGPLCDLDIRKNKLQKQINELERYI